MCTDCLSRLHISNNAFSRLSAKPIQLPQTSSFHSSAIRNAKPLMKPKSEIQKRVLNSVRSSQSTRLKKKPRERPKLPPVGERRAQRRRIVLSNTNALAVDGMENWSTENMTDPQLIGQVAGLDGALLDQLRDAKAFKRTQNWSLFRRPATLIRNETIAIGNDVESVNDRTTIKHLVVGERHTGKSILMLQTMCMAYMNNWLVLNVPEGMLKGFEFEKNIELTPSSTRICEQYILLCSSATTGRQTIRGRATLYPATSDPSPPHTRAIL